MDGITWTRYTAPVSVSTQGITTIYYRSTDSEGNIETAQTQEIRIDNIAPITTADLSGTTGINGWFTNPVKVTLAAADNPAGSKVSGIQYTIDGGIQTGYIIPFTVNKEGSTTITFTSTDNAGNTESKKTQLLKIDSGVPVITITTPLDKDYLQSDTITLGFSATDMVSGIASVTAILDDISVNSGLTVDLSTLVLGSHTIQVTATDMAGNSALASRTFMVKAIPATIDIDPNTLNLGSNSDKNAFTAYIEIPGYDVNSIDVSSVKIITAKGTANAQAAPITIGDNDQDGIPDRMVKFNRQSVISIVDPGTSIVLTVRGLVAGDTFEGTDAIRVNEGGKKK